MRSKEHQKSSLVLPLGAGQPERLMLYSQSDGVKSRVGQANSQVPLSVEPRVIAQLVAAHPNAPYAH